MKIIITFRHGNTMVKIKTEINSVLIISLIKNFFLFINFVIFITISQKRIDYFINNLKLKELPIITSFEEEGKPGIQAIQLNFGKLPVLGLPAGLLQLRSMIQEKIMDTIVGKMIARKKEQKPFKYDVSLSYANENRKIAKNLAQKLKNKGMRVFFDNFYQFDLWGKSLKKVFSEVFGPKTRFAVVLISEYYPVKEWTNFEFSIMKEEAKKRETEFILPIRLDNTKMPGIHEDIGYLDYRKVGIDGIVDCLLGKLSMGSSDQE